MKDKVREIIKDWLNPDPEEEDGPTGEEALQHLAEHVRYDLESGLDAIVLICGKGKRGTGTGIGKTTLSFRLAEAVAPGWMEHALAGAFSAVTYSGDDISRFREKARGKELINRVLTQDEAVFALLSSETLTPQGRHLLKEITSCRDDALFLVLIMDKWKMLPAWLLDSIPYAVTIPSVGHGIVHIPKVYPSGIDYERESKRFNKFPWNRPNEDCFILGHDGRNYSELTWEQVPEDGVFWKAYLEYKHRRRAEMLEVSRAVASGKALKDQHEGEAHTEMERKIRRAMHLLGWDEKNPPTQAGPLCPCQDCVVFQSKPSWALIHQALKPCGMNVLQIASGRLKLAASQPKSRGKKAKVVAGEGVAASEQSSDNLRLQSQGSSSSAPLSNADSVVRKKVRGRKVT